MEAFAKAIIAVDAMRQQELIGYMGAALENIAKSTGCATALDVWTTIKDSTVEGGTAGVSVPAVTTDQLLQLCAAVLSCPGSGPDMSLVGR